MAPDPEMSDMELLGRYVKRGRAMLGIGQRLLAARAGVSQSAVARLELGRATGMPTVRLVAIAAARRARASATES